MFEYYLKKKKILAGLFLKEICTLVTLFIKQLFNHCNSVQHTFNFKVNIETAWQSVHWTEFIMYKCTDNPHNFSLYLKVSCDLIVLLLGLFNLWVDVGAELAVILAMTQIFCQVPG